MKARLSALAARFAALRPREKLLVAAAGAFAIAMGGYTLWVEPPLLRAAALLKLTTQQQAEVQGLQAQLAGMRSQLKDPDAPNKAALADVRRQLAATDQALHAYDNALVPPERVPQLLQALIARHRGIELLSLRSLPPATLLAPAKTAARDEGETAPASAKGGNIHKHGIEIRVAGSYLDLLSYVADIEGLPQKLLWGGMSLTVTAYPRSELTLTVYTLSLDPTWMVV